MEEQKCQLHRFLLAAAQAGRRRRKNYTMNRGSVSDLERPLAFYYCHYLPEIRECMDLSVFSFRSKRHMLHCEHLQRKVGARRSPAYSVSSYIIQYWHVRSVFLFSRSLTEWVQLQPPFTRKDLKLNTVASVVSSCRVTEMNQDWKQAVRRWSWQPSPATFLCLSPEAGQTRYLGKH